MGHLQERGIASNVHFMPLPLLTLHKNRGEDISNYPNSQLAFGEVISLPLHLQMNLDDINYVVESCVQFIDEFPRND